MATYADLLAKRGSRHVQRMGGICMQVFKTVESGDKNRVAVVVRALVYANFHRAQNVYFAVEVFKSLQNLFICSFVPGLNFHITTCLIMLFISEFYLNITFVMS